MTTAAVPTADIRRPTALRLARAVARIHLVLAICLAGYIALWTTTLQSSEGQLAEVGVSRTDIKLMWFSLAAVVVLAIAGARLVGRLPGPARVRWAAVAVYGLAVLNAVWQATMVYLHTTLPLILVPAVVTVLLLVGRERPA